MTPEQEREQEFLRQFKAFLEAMEQAAKKLEEELKKEAQVYQVVENERIRVVLCKNWTHSKPQTTNIVCH